MFLINQFSENYRIVFYFFFKQINFFKKNNFFLAKENLFFFLNFIALNKSFQKIFLFYAISNLNNFNWKYFFIFLKFINSSSWFISINNFYFFRNFFFNKEKSLELKDFFVKRLIKRFEDKKIIKRRKNKLFMKLNRFQKLLWRLRKKFKFSFFKKKSFKTLNKKNYSFFLQMFYSFFKNFKFFKKEAKIYWFYFNSNDIFFINQFNKDAFLINKFFYEPHYFYYLINTGNTFIFKNLFFKINKFDIFKFKFSNLKKIKSQISYQQKIYNTLPDLTKFFKLSDNAFQLIYLNNPFSFSKKKLHTHNYSNNLSNFKVLSRFFLLNFLKFDFSFFFNKKFFLNFSNSFIFLFFNKHYVFEKFDGVIFQNNFIEYNSITPLHFLDKPLRRLVFTKFQKSFTPDFFKYVYYYISSYLENFTKKRIFFKFNSKIKMPYEDFIRLNTVFFKHRNFQFKIGRGFFFFEMLEVIWLSFFYKDLSFLIEWFIKTMERIPFKNHRKLLSVFKFIIVNYFSIFSKKNIKGFFFDIRGKVGVSGNAKKRHFSFYKGKYSKTTKNSRFDYQYNIIRTFTGALGVTMVLYY